MAEYRGVAGFNESIWGGSFTFQTINKGGVMSNPNPKISRFNTRRICVFGKGGVAIFLTLMGGGGSCNFII